jgi:hypothetical protein
MRPWSWIRRPPHPAYAGIAVYCEWEMTPEEWALLKREFLRPGG